MQKKTSRIPDDILEIFKKRHVRTLELHPNLATWYPNTKEGLDEHIRTACEEYGNLNCEIQDGKEILKERIERSMKFHGTTYDEEYKIFVFCNRGTIYEKKPIPERYERKGIFYPSILDFEKETRHRYYIENLHPKTRIILYHGSTCITAYNAVTTGIDLNVVPCHEVYHEIIMSSGAMVGRYRQPGIYISPSYEAASTFAGTGCVIKFVKSAEHLFPPPSFEYELEVKGINIDDNYLESHPELSNSFRPSVSYWMLTRNEPQAFLKESIRPNEVLAIWEYDYALKKKTRKSVEDFIKGFKR